VRDLFAGAACLARGIAIFAATPGLWAIGLLPAVLALLALGALLVALVLALPAAVAALTGFAAGWPAAERDALRLLIEAALLVGAVWLSVVSYTALTLAIGQPLYETISRRVEAREGGAPVEAPEPRLRAVWRAARDGLLLVALTALLGLAIFFLGLVPAVGQVAGPVAGACVGGFMLAAELSGVALERRGLHLSERLGLLWRRRLLAIGFGLPTFLLFLLPLGAVLGMPAAVVGGTLLARRLVSPARV
jgi:CysZ protein